MNNEPPNFRTVWFLWLFILSLLLFIGEAYWSLLISKSEVASAEGIYHRRPRPAKGQPTTPEPSVDASVSRFPNFYSSRPPSEPAAGSAESQETRRSLTTLPSRSPLGSPPIGTGSAPAAGQQRVAVVDTDRILATVMQKGYSKEELKNLLPTIKAAAGAIASEHHITLVLNRSALSPSSTSIFFVEEDWFDLTDAVLNELEKTRAQVTSR
jgi:hypothetical protein